MTTPTALHLFAPNFYEHVDVTTQVERMPGTADAPCLCGRVHGCAWPWCTPPEKENA